MRDFNLFCCMSTSWWYFRAGWTPVWPLSVLFCRLYVLGLHHERYFLYNICVCRNMFVQEDLFEGSQRLLSSISSIGFCYPQSLPWREQWCMYYMRDFQSVLLFLFLGVARGNLIDEKLFVLTNHVDKNSHWFVFSERFCNFVWFVGRTILAHERMMKMHWYALLGMSHGIWPNI